MQSHLLSLELGLVPREAQLQLCQSSRILLPLLASPTCRRWRANGEREDQQRNLNPRQPQTRHTLPYQLIAPIFHYVLRKIPLRTSMAVDVSFFEIPDVPLRLSRAPLPSRSFRSSPGATSPKTGRASRRCSTLPSIKKTRRRRR